MKNQLIILKPILILAFCLAACPFLLAADHNDKKVEAELTKLEQQWDAALVAVDIPALKAIMAEEFIGTSDDGETYTREEGIKDLQDKTDVISAADSSELKVMVYGNTAVVTGVWTAKEENKGKDVSGAHRFTDTWVKRDGRWQCVASHTSLIKKEK